MKIANIAFLISFISTFPFVSSVEDLTGGGNSKNITLKGGGNSKNIPLKDGAL